MSKKGAFTQDAPTEGGAAHEVQGMTDQRVLVADDDPDIRDLLKFRLEHAGFDVLAANDGEQAWRMLATPPPPLLALLDWQMPGMTGIDLCKRLRAQQSDAYTYVVMLTARDSRADMLAAFDAGVDDYLTKPIDRAELQARLMVGRRIVELMTTVRQLEGLLPICAWCKRIRDDTDDSWHTIESYIHERTGTNFTHGACPMCFERALREAEQQRV